METTYKAVEAPAPGTLRIVERPIREPGVGQVRIWVEAWGICHTDTLTIEGQFPGLTFPRVPGHEVVGRIEAISQGVSRWKVGQQVGLGFFGGEDGECELCRRGDFVNCQKLIIPGITVDGGYAEVMIAEARALASIPDALSTVDAAPFSARASQPTTHFAMRLCAPATWWRYSVLVGLDILASSSRGEWGSVRSQSREGAKRKS